MRKTILTLILLLSIPAVLSASISTDKNDYYLKQSILISGQGFQPNIHVIIQINDPEGVVKFVDQIRTDDNGEFSTAYVTKSDDSLGLYSVYASGGGEQAQESFTISKGPSITILKTIAQKFNRKILIIGLLIVIVPLIIILVSIKSIIPRNTIINAMKKLIPLFIIFLLSFSIVLALSLSDISSQGSEGSSIFDKFKSVFRGFLSTPEVTSVNYILFARHPFDENYIISGTVPTSAEKQAANRLSMFASRNEYESTSFAIYNPSDIDLEDVEVSIESLTKGGDIIGLENIDVRVIKVLEIRNVFNDLSAGLHESPEVLIPYTDDYRAQGEFDVPGGESKQWWVTVKVNTDTTPGIYTGTISINPSNGPEKTIPIELEVSQTILLVNDEQISGLYYWQPYLKVWKWNKIPGLFEKVVKADFALMKEMGLQTVVLFYPQPSYARFLLEEAHRAGLDNYPMVIDTHQIGASGAVSFENLRKEMVANGESNIPEFYWYPVDEPFHDLASAQIEPFISRRESFIQKVPLLRQALPNDKIFVTLHSNRWKSQWSETRSGVYYEQYMDVQAHSQSINTDGMCTWTPDSLADYFDRHNQIGYMYLNRNRGKPYDYRIDHGLFLWMLPVMKGNIPWIYQAIAIDPYNDTDYAGGGRGDIMYAYPDLTDLTDNPKSHPALKLIGIREGIDDIRYLYTLEKAIEHSSNENKKREAREFLEIDIRKRINSTIGVEGRCNHYTDKIQELVGPQQLDDWRQQISQMIINLGQPPVPTTTSSTSTTVPTTTSSTSTISTTTTTITNKPRIQYFRARDISGGGQGQLTPSECMHRGEKVRFYMAFEDDNTANGNMAYCSGSICPNGNPRIWAGTDTDSSNGWEYFAAKETRYSTNQDYWYYDWTIPDNAPLGSVYYRIIRACDEECLSVNGWQTDGTFDICSGGSTTTTSQTTTTTTLTTTTSTTIQQTTTTVPGTTTSTTTTTTAISSTTTTTTLITTTTTSISTSTSVTTTISTTTTTVIVFPIEILEIQTLDSNYNPTDHIKSGQQYYLKVTIKNIGPETENPMLVVQITNSKNEVVGQINSLKSSISPENINYLEVGYFENVVGDYKAEAFVWSGWPALGGEPLASSSSKTFTVSE
ncbi:MAG: hypothetical protein ISS48_02700 [Candidatus Aenigmarchaeota archaeon]|nr:hypothetical protein [Candidatus Aenigmarchaeota archaeon]